MENNPTSVTVNLSDGSFSISGPAEFVEKNIGNVFEFIEKYLGKPPRVQKCALLTEAKMGMESNAIADESTSSVPMMSTADKDRFIQAGVYHVDAADGSISILKKIPGANKTEKTKNIALIVLYVKDSRIQGKELIPLCEKHACYDSNNFAATFKKDISNFIRKGSGQNWTIELTKPGEEAALALLEEMVDDKKCDSK